MRAPIRLLALATTLSLTAAASAQSAERMLWHDLDRDGRPDLYRHGAGRDDALLRNTGDGGFVDVTAEAGLAGSRSRQVLPADFDGDGHEDFCLVTQAGELRLLRGLDGLAFEDATPVGGLEGLEGAEHAGWIDYDQDGRPDLHVSTAAEDVLFRNLGQGALERVRLDLPAAPVSGFGAPGAPVEPPTPTEVTTPPEEPNRVGPSRRLVPMTEEMAEPAPGSQPLGTPPGTSTNAQALPLRARAIEDRAVGGGYLHASSAPTLGMLYPISQDWFVDAATGNVGIGTTSPTAPLDVAGGARLGGTTTIEGRLYADDDVEVRGGGKILARNTFTSRTVALDPAGFANGGELALSDSGGATRMSLRGGESTLDIHDATKNRTTSLTDAGLDLYRSVDPANPTATLEGEGPNAGGSLRLANDQREVTVRALGDAGSDAAALELSDGFAGAPVQTVRLAARRSGSVGGGEVSMRTDAGNETIQLVGDAGSEEGQILLRDTSSGSPVDGVALRAKHVFGSGEGGVVTVLNGEGQVTARLIGDEGNDSGHMNLRNRDGTNNFIGVDLRAAGGPGQGSKLVMRDAAGQVSFQVDGAGNASQPVSADGLVKAAVLVNGFNGGIRSSFNHLVSGGTVTVTKVSFTTGLYDVDFGVDISNRFLSVMGIERSSTSPVTEIRAIFPSVGTKVRIATVGGFSSVNGDFSLLVY